MVEKGLFLVSIGQLISKKVTVLFVLPFAAGAAMTSFLLGWSCNPPSPVDTRVDVVSSSARMLSSFDSTPARKEPHLEVAFGAGGGDAISTTDFRLI